MEHISDTLNALTTPRRPASPEPVPNGNAAPQSERVMTRLWLRMTKIYGHRWTAGFGESDDGTWAKGLRGMSPEQIAFGLSRCVERGDSWPPTLPEFRALCTPTAADLGLPDVDCAYREATHAEPGHAWTHPAVYAAAQGVGLYELRNLPESKTRPAFAKAYETACGRVLAGESLSAPIPKGLEKIATPAKPETVSDALTKMREALHG